MSNKMKFQESAVISKSNNKFRMRIIKPGKGSSANYLEETLRRDGPTAWPIGTQIFFDHLTEGDYYERRGQHSIKDLVGVTTATPEYIEGDENTGGLWTDVRFFENAVGFISDAMEFIEASIEASGMQDDEGNAMSIIYSPTNAIALVPRGGAGGKISHLIESYRENSTEETQNSENSDIMDEGTPVLSDSRKENGMTPEDINKIVEGLTAAIGPALTQIQESLKPAELVEVEVVSLTDTVKAIVEAKLPDAAQERVYAALEQGQDVVKAIETEKAYVNQLRESFVADKDDEDSAGRFVEGRKVDYDSQFDTLFTK